MMINMLLVALQIMLLITATLLPLRALGVKRNNYHIDRDTSNAHYAINEQGELEEIHSTNHPEEKSI